MTGVESVKKKGPQHGTNEARLNWHKILSSMSAQQHCLQTEEHWKHHETRLSWQDTRHTTPQQAENKCLHTYNRLSPTDNVLEVRECHVFQILYDHQTSCCWRHAQAADGIAAQHLTKTKQVWRKQIKNSNKYGYLQQVRLHRLCIEDGQTCSWLVGLWQMNAWL
jgi:hypothetical protein